MREKSQLRESKSAPPEDGSQGSEFLNRDLNWLEFNRKVLLEAEDQGNPLLERVKFLSIFYNNLEEFFMVRVAGLTRQRKLGIGQVSVDGLSATEQLIQVRKTVISLHHEAAELWSRKLRPELFASGLKFIGYQNLSQSEQKQLTAYFHKDIFPILTPQALDKGRPFPQISSGSLNLFIELADPGGKIYQARLKIPDNLPNFICLPVAHGNLASQTFRTKFSAKGVKILPLDILIGHHLGELFPGYEVRDHILFRITRNTDIEIEEDEADDLLAAVRDLVYQRRFGEVVRLETMADAAKHLVDQLMRSFDLEHWQHYVLKGRLGGEKLDIISGLDIPRLRFPPFSGHVLRVLKKNKSFFKILKKNDVFLYHPYDSFSPVIDFVRQAARDPKVKAIKQTLYRTGNDSSLIEALIEARRADKQVTAVVELKARFDEMRNITWAQALEEAGINVVYGLVGMKIHAKLCLIIRQEDDGLKTYVHVGTGNYNPITARIYTDLGLLTANEAIGRDAVQLFNVMTGLATIRQYEHLLVSPLTTRPQIIARIEREAAQHQKDGSGFLAIKVNQLSDPQIIEALYRASQAGVRIRLQVRGVCCLRPGVPGLSPTITVTSLVGRFLEHTRIIYFHNGGNSEMFIGSTDLMPRNLDRRIEVLAPILDEELKEMIYRDILLLHLADNQKTYELQSTGSYIKVPAGAGEEAIDSQARLLERARDLIQSEKSLAEKFPGEEL
ncbi:MAG: polyphosphate kinase 1 [Deltaproteobacteria bacterium]|jgi:polyphosphate kinase|nr:polyphosphate kinase 1 [Deltaproteobacteria bacterium]